MNQDEIETDRIRKAKETKAMISEATRISLPVAAITGGALIIIGYCITRFESLEARVARSELLGAVLDNRTARIEATIERIDGRLEKILDRLDRMGVKP